MSPFKVVGSLIIAWAVVILLYLPHGPHDGRTLSEYERIVAVWQISKNRTGVQRPKFLPYQIKEVPLDAKIYLLPLMAAALGILNGSVSNFMSTLIKGFGFPPPPPTRSCQACCSQSTIATTLASRKRIFRGARSSCVSTILLCCCGKAPMKRTTISVQEFCPRSLKTKLAPSLLRGTQLRTQMVHIRLDHC